MSRIFSELEMVSNGTRGKLMSTATYEYQEDGDPLITGISYNVMKHAHMSVFDDEEHDGRLAVYITNVTAAEVLYMLGCQGGDAE